MTKENQKFGIGDIAKIKKEDVRVKVVGCCLDDGVWWYEVDAIDFDAPFTREVKQESLEML